MNANITGYYFYELRNSRTSKLYVLTFNLTNNIDLQRGKNSVALSNLNIYYTWKNIKS